MQLIGSWEKQVRHSKAEGDGPSDTVIQVLIQVTLVDLIWAVQLILMIQMV